MRFCERVFIAGFAVLAAVSGNLEGTGEVSSHCNALRLWTSTDRIFVNRGLSTVLTIDVLVENTSGEEAVCTGMGRNPPPWTAEIVSLDEGAVVHEYHAYVGPWGQWEFRLQPFELLVHDHHEWDLLDADGTQVGSGWYQLRLSSPALTYPGFVVGQPFLVCDDSQCQEPTTAEVLYVPVAANTAGLAGTQWQSDLLITATSEWWDEQVVTVTWLDEGRESTPISAEVELPPTFFEPSFRIKNVVGELLGTEGTGALRIELTTPYVTVTSRTSNIGPDGQRRGVTIPALDPSEAVLPGREAIIPDLDYSPDRNVGARSNIGMLSLSATDTVVRIYLYDSDEDGYPDELGDHLELVLTPFEHRQLNDVFRRVTDEAICNGFALVAPADGGLLAYGAVVDNVSCDTRFVLAHHFWFD